MIGQRASSAAEWIRSFAWIRSSSAGPQRPVDAATLRRAVVAAKPLIKVVEVSAANGSLVSRIGWLDGWMARAQSTWVKPGSERSLLSLLRDDDADVHWPPGDEENLHCCAYCTPDAAAVPAAPNGIASRLGVRPAHEVAEVTWVGCDACDGWFHAVCVHVPEEQATQRHPRLPHPIRPPLPGCAPPPTSSALPSHPCRPHPISSPSNEQVEQLQSYLCPRCCHMRSEPYLFCQPQSPLGGQPRPPPLRRSCRPMLAEVRQRAAPHPRQQCIPRRHLVHLNAPTPVQHAPPAYSAAGPAHPQHATRPPQVCELTAEASEYAMVLPEAEAMLQLQRNTEEFGARVRRLSTRAVHGCETVAPRIRLFPRAPPGMLHMADVCPGYASGTASDAAGGGQGQTSPVIAGS